MLRCTGYIDWMLVCERGRPWRLESVFHLAKMAKYFTKCSVLMSVVDAKGIERNSVK